MDEEISTTSDYFRSTQILSFLNDEQSKLIHALIKKDRGHFLSSSTITFVSDQEEYDLPENMHTAKHAEATGQINSGARRAKVYIEDVSDRQYADTGNTSLTDEERYHMAIRGGKWHFLETPKSNRTGAIRVYYYIKPIPMHYGTIGDPDEAPAIDGTTDLRLGDVVTVGSCMALDKVYHEAKIQMTSGTAANLNAIRVITTYSGSLKQATVDVALSSASQDGDGYEILSMLDYDDLEVLILGAMKRAMVVDGKADVWNQSHKEDYTELYFELLRKYRVRQVNNPALRTRMVYM